MSALLSWPETEPETWADLADADLARRVATGAAAREAEAELCRRLRPRLRLYGLRHLREPAAADDLAQDVLLLTIERLRAGRIRDPERIASFMLGASRLMVRNRRRGQARRQALLDRHPAPVSTVPEPGLDPLDSRRLRDCLQALESRQQSVLVLTFYSERSAIEIAAELALTPENVRAIRHRALARLRECVLGSVRG